MSGEPYNYGAQLANPMQAFTQGLQIGTVLDQQQVAAQEAQAKRAREQEMAVELQSLQQDRSPANVERILFKFPEFKDRLTASQGAVDDATKATGRNFYSQLIMLRNAGLNDRADALFRETIAMMENTPGKEQQAQTLKTMYQTYQAKPEAIDTAAALYLQATDPDFYKTISTQSELTSFQKNLTAAGIDPNSEQGRGMAMQFAQRQADPIVEMQTPSGGRFVGPYSLYVDKYGASGAQPSPVSNVTSKAQYDALPAGATYVAPDGSVRTKGGGSGNATGGFR